MFVSFPLIGKVNGNVFKNTKKRCEEREGDLKKKGEHEQRLENKQTESRAEERKGDKKKMKRDK